MAYARGSLCAFDAVFHLHPSYKYASTHAGRGERNVMAHARDSICAFDAVFPLHPLIQGTHEVRYACLARCSRCALSCKYAVTHAGRCEQKIVVYAQGSLCVFDAVFPLHPLVQKRRYVRGSM
jgi:hypothetical protein